MNLDSLDLGPPPGCPHTSTFSDLVLCVCLREWTRRACCPCGLLLHERENISRRCFPWQVYGRYWLSALKTLIMWWNKNVILPTIDKPHHASLPPTPLPLPHPLTSPDDLVRKWRPVGFIAPDQKHGQSLSYWCWDFVLKAGICKW